MLGRIRPTLTSLFLLSNSFDKNDELLEYSVTITQVHSFKIII